MNRHGRILLLYGETIPRHLITQSLAWILLRRAPGWHSPLGYAKNAPGYSTNSMHFLASMKDAGQNTGLSRHLYLVDGANAFDAYGLVRLIARQGQDPSVALKRIHVSRAFTCYQLAERIAALTPCPSLNDVQAGGGTEGSPALYLLGLLDTFYDESVPLLEALRLLDQVLAQLRRRRARDTLVIIVTKLPPVKTADRAVMVQRVQEHADAVYRIGNE